MRTGDGVRSHEHRRATAIIACCISGSESLAHFLQQHRLHFLEQAGSAQIFIFIFIILFPIPRCISISVPEVCPAMQCTLNSPFRIDAFRDTPTTLPRDSCSSPSPRPKSGYRSMPRRLRRFPPSL